MEVQLYQSGSGSELVAALLRGFDTHAVGGEARQYFGIAYVSDDIHRAGRAAFVAVTSGSRPPEDTEAVAVGPIGDGPWLYDFTGTLFSLRVDGNFAVDLAAPVVATGINRERFVNEICRRRIVPLAVELDIADVNTNEPHEFGQGPY